MIILLKPACVIVKRRFNKLVLLQGDQAHDIHVTTWWQNMRIYMENPKLPFSE